MINQWFGGIYKDARDPNNLFARFAVEPEKLFTMYSEYSIPDDQKKAFVRERTACVVGRDLAKKFHFQAGRPHQPHRAISSPAISNSPCAASSTARASAS